MIPAALERLLSAHADWSQCYPRSRARAKEVAVFDKVEDLRRIALVIFPRNPQDESQQREVEQALATVAEQDGITVAQLMERLKEYM